MALTPVQKELGKIAADYRRYRIVQSLIRCWGLITFAGLFFLILYWIFGIQFSWALPALLASGLIAVAWVIWRSSRNEVALRQVARLAEQDDPRLNSLLLAALEQEPDPATGELNFLQVRVLREALEANRRSPWQQKFVERLFFAQCSHVAALVAVAVVLAWLASIQPDLSTPRLARDGIEITPGNVEVERGSALAIVAHFAKDAPNDVSLVYQTRSGGEKLMPMTRSLSDPLFGASFTDLQEDASYRVRYGNELSPEYQITVFEYPELKRADVALKYPDYTSFPPAKTEDTRRVTAVEGTDVHYTFYLNKPVRSATLRGKKGGEIVLTNSESGDVVYEAEFPLIESMNYSLELVDEAGRTNKLPAEFVFVAKKNETPKIKLIAPGGDQRVTALQEVRFEGKAEDDFGLGDYGIAYTLAGQDTHVLSLAKEEEAAGPSLTGPHEARTFASLLALEQHSAEVGQLVSFYLWADDLGPDGKTRRTASDIYFAEVRPFEEVFREGNGAGEQQNQQQQQGQNNPASQLLELQKEIITATWNLHRRENGDRPSSEFKADVEVVHESQVSAIDLAGEMKERVNDEKSKALINTAVREMTKASKELSEAAEKNVIESLTTALEPEQKAYQALLKLQAREFQVQRSQNSQGGQQQRAQRQLDQMELNEEENRYQTESQASPIQSAEQRETLQVLNRLKELARRQEDMTERLKELQIALNEAKTPEEREEIERQLKRLQEEQQQIVQDMDEAQQRMSQAENQSRMAEARKQLEETRRKSLEAAEQLQEGNVGQALSSSAKAEEQLEKLSDEMRKSTSSQFSEAMREMRDQARQLEKRQEELSRKLQEKTDSRRRSLSDEGPQQEVIDGLAQQKGALTNLLQNIREVTEQAEAAEPLLARQLYETLRRTSQANPEKTLDLASQLLERNFIPQAVQTQEKALETISELKEGVERAANSVLGDEAESLRFAERELEKLAERVERELALARAGAATNAVGSGSENVSTNAIVRRYFPHLAATNSPASLAEGGTNQVGGGAFEISPEQQEQIASGRQAGEPGEDGQGSGEREGQQQASAGGEQGEGQLNQQNEQQASSSQSGSDGPQGNSGQQGGPNQQASQNQSSERQGGGSRQQGGQDRGGGDGGNFFEQWANEGGGGSDGGRGGGSAHGPLTGSDFTSWSDRLRDLEEVLQDSALRNDVARVRERARTMRMEFKRDSKEPQWDLVDAEIAKPLRMLQSRVAEELARRESRDAVVPIDRDPVPSRYSELVSRYYETLGKE